RRDVRERERAEEDVLALALPAHGLRVRRLPAVADVAGRPRDAADEEHLAVEQAVRDLVEELLAAVHPVDREEALVGPGRVRDDLGVGLEAVARLVFLLLRIGGGDPGGAGATRPYESDGEDEQSNETEDGHGRADRVSVTERGI